MITIIILLRTTATISYTVVWTFVVGEFVELVVGGWWLGGFWSVAIALVIVM